jgi:hypothetical protein
MKVAVRRIAGSKDHRAFGGAAPAWITESAARLESTARLEAAKTFADQAAVDTYVTSRGGNTAEWLLVDIAL